MPFVRIDLDGAIPVHRRRAIADAIHDALVAYDRPTKAAMFTAIADALVAAGVRRDDIFATVTGNAVEDWYAGVDSVAVS